VNSYDDFRPAETASGSRWSFKLCTATLNSNAINVLHFTAVVSTSTSIIHFSNPALIKQIITYNVILCQKLYEWSSKNGRPRLTAITCKIVNNISKGNNSICTAKTFFKPNCTLYVVHLQFTFSQLIQIRKVKKSLESMLCLYSS